MASTYSSLLKIELIATGEQDGAWGATTNQNLGTALEEAITGVGNPSFTSDANLTISFSDTPATQIARNLVLNATSTVSLTATRNLVVPDGPKQYIVWNATTGGQSIVVKTSAGTGVTVPNGARMHLFADGTNVIPVSNYIPQATLVGTKELGIAVAAAEIDLNAANYFTKTVTGDITFTLANVPASGVIANFILQLTNGGAHTVTWWANIRWPEGVPPVLTASGTDVLGFFTSDAGANWYSFLIGEDMS